MTLLGFLILITPYRAWSAQEDELIEGAKKEGRVMIYHSNNISNYTSVIKRFKEKYPFIAVDSYQAPWSKLLFRVLEEEKARKSPPDIFDARSFAIHVLKEKGLLMKYVSPNFRFIPQEFIDPEGFYWSNCYSVMGVAYNTKLVPLNDVPKSWDDVLNPKWKGKLFLEDRDYEWYGNMQEIMGKEKGLEFMKKLSKQNVQFRFGKVLMNSLVAAGEIPIFLTAAGSMVEQFKEKGASVNWVAYDTIIGMPSSMGIFSHAAHPHAAKLFVNFLSSKEGQELLAMSTGKNPTRSDAKHKYPNLEAVVKGHRLFLSNVTTDYYTKFNTEFQAMFKPR